MEFKKNFFDLNKVNEKNISGLTGESFGLYLANLMHQKKKNILVVVNSLYEANNIYNTVRNYTDDTFIFPMDDFLTSEAIISSPELKVNRLETLNNTINKKCGIYITNLMGYLRFLPSKDSYRNSIINLKVGMEISPQKIAEHLYDIGYQKETIVTKTGDFGIRNFIIDVFVLGFDRPVRIEFFGDEIVSLRFFDEDTQKSLEEVNEISIMPYWEFIGGSKADESERGLQKYLNKFTNVVNISDYLENPTIIFKDYYQIETGFSNFLEEKMEYKAEKDKNYTGEYMFSLSDVEKDNCIYFNDINNIKKINEKNFNVEKINIKFSSEEEILFYLEKQIKSNMTVNIVLKSYQLNKLEKILKGKLLYNNNGNILENTINVIEGAMNEGFIVGNYIFLTSKEIFNSTKSKIKYNSHFQYGKGLKSINRLSVGDYVVHELYGIGQYKGLKTLANGDIIKDYLEIIYKGADKLYVSVDKIEYLSKYSGKEGSSPKINTLGGSDWKKTKSRVKAKVTDMANKLLKLYAEREQKKGFDFSLDDEMMLEFENSFDYKLTKDQKLAINQIKKDMELSIPMDRLLCGDVGFGKTEVAFVAAFKAIKDSKQVLFLCPTTILSNQHYKSALNRFKDFPVNIKLLNRFTPSKEVKLILEGLKNNTIDMIIGTHRLLSEDIDLKDLGLLIVDEEQRFGVTHKEKLKRYKVNVDVLTLTATPIPRTLQMSMVGIRSLSLIETPPKDRFPIQTYVLEENDMILKDVIYKELSRKGQVFILHNQVASIEREVAKIKELVPEAKVTFAHGQMQKNVLENRILDFIEKKYDILVCTTIIETGIDIPNVNTLIIKNADNFGLSQLYQIRGRVGRSDKFAYAYLMYKKSKLLTEVAKKRLDVIKEFTALGSGFSIAARDLSIRGAGDILGKEQAGFIDSVGIDMYLKMLDDEINNKQGEDVDDDKFEKKSLLNISTHIKDDYVKDDELKIEIHKLINSIDTKEKLTEIKNELMDRFGRIDEDLNVYLLEEYFEKKAKTLNILQVKESKNNIEMILPTELLQKVGMDIIFVNSQKITQNFSFKKLGNKVILILDLKKLEKHPVYYLTEFLEIIEEEKGI